MKLVYTQQALDGLKESLDFLSPKVSPQSILSIRDRILNKADTLIAHPRSGKIEEYLEHLGLNHRRIIESHYKIIYRIEEQTIYITDIFDSRQSPDKMKG